MTSPLARRQISAAAMSILMLALVVRLTAVLLIHNAQYSDSVWYDNAATRLATIHEYGVSGRSAWFPPGYPMFLAAIYAFAGHSQLAGRIANAVLGAITCLLVYLTGRRLVGERQGLAAGALVAIWPNLVFHTLILDSETLSAAQFTAVIWIGTLPADTRRAFWLRAVAFGLLLGWSMLTRPAAAILVVAVATYWALQTRSPREIVRVLAVPVLIASVFIVGWSARNRAQFGEWIPVSTNGGYNFWQANNAYANGNDTFWPSVPRGIPEFETMRSGDEFTRNREGYRYGLAFLRAHPWHPLTSAWTKFMWLYHTDTSGLYEGVLNAPELSPSGVAAWFKRHQHLAESLTFRFYFVVMLLALAALLLAAPSTRPAIWSLASLGVLLLGFHLFFHAKDRFHVPLAPAFALMAGVTTMWLYDAARRRTVAAP